MTKTNTTRTREEISQEYTNICAQHGNALHQINVFNKLIIELEKMKIDLDKESSELKAAEIANNQEAKK